MKGFFQQIGDAFIIKSRIHYNAIVLTNLCLTMAALALNQNKRISNGLTAGIIIGGYAMVHAILYKNYIKAD